MPIYGLYICVINNCDKLKIQGHFLNLDILITVLNILLEIEKKFTTRNTHIQEYIYIYIQEIYIVTIKNNNKKLK